jgi:hypothetical protein
MIPTEAAAKNNTTYTVTLNQKMTYLSVCIMGVDSSWHVELSKMPVDPLCSSTSKDASDSTSEDFPDMPVNSGKCSLIMMMTMGKKPKK